MKKNAVKIKHLFRITQDQYPVGLPGHKLPKIGDSYPFGRNKSLKIVDQYWAKTFYGPNDMYSAWTAGLLFENGKYYSHGAMGLSDKPTEIIWLSEIPEAHIAYKYKVSVAEQVLEKLQYNFTKTNPWPLANLITYHTVEQLESLNLQKVIPNEFKEELLTMHNIPA